MRNYEELNMEVIVFNGDVTTENEGESFEF